jgi:hypothetical protein
MTESDSSAAVPTQAPAAAEPTTNTTSPSPALPAVEETSSWKLPVGIEDHLEAGMLSRSSKNFKACAECVFLRCVSHLTSLSHSNNQNPQ